MADSDSGVGMHQEQCHGFADDVATAENNGVCAFDGDAVAAKNLHAACGRAGDESGAAADQTTEAYWMKAVNVLRGIDSLENALGVDLGREGKLDENAIDGVIVVQVLDEAQHLFGGDGGRMRANPTGQAELLARGDFGFHVKLL